MKTIVACGTDAGMRVDKFLSEKTGITRSQIQRMIDRGNVRVNDIAVSAHHKVRPHDVITWIIPQRESGNLKPEPLSLSILYEDRYLVVVDKPAGMVVYPAAGHSQGTLMNALAHHCASFASVGGPLRPGVVHRLDKDTSGVMVVALDDDAYYSLVEQFRQRGISRKYLALVYGTLKTDAGEIAIPIGRAEHDRKKMSTKTRRGREAITRWKALRRFRGATLVEVRLGTGRTHQIRVHFASIGHPVLGDRIYGRKTEVADGRRRILFPRQMLHAATLGFQHPRSNEYIEFSSPLPEDMEQAIKELTESGSS